MPNHDSYVAMEDGTRLFVRTTGKGDDSVLVPNGHYLYDDFRALAERRPAIFWDPRNRGRSDQVTDAAKLQRGVQQDADDLETLRHRCGAKQVHIVAHSYAGIIAILYAMRYPSRVKSIVLIGPPAPDPGRRYSDDLAYADGVLQNALAAIAKLQKERGQLPPVEFCERVWSLLTPVYVANPADAAKLRWAQCDLPNERSFMKYWLEYLYPSIRQLQFGPIELEKVRAPVLIIHGKKDRSSPYGAGRDWALRLPTARLLTVAEAAHAPWIELPQLVFGSIQTFLSGTWPDRAERLREIE